MRGCTIMQQPHFVLSVIKISLGMHDGVGDMKRACTRRAAVGMRFQLPAAADLLIIGHISCCTVDSQPVEYTFFDLDVMLS